jgi:hypothetical protein
VPPLRRVRTALLVVGLLFGLVACSGSSSSSGNSDANGVTRHHGPAVLGKDGFASALAHAQAQAGTAHVRATISATGQAGRVSADVKGLGDLSNAAVNLSLDLAGQHLQLVVADRILYIKGAPLGGQPGKPWLKVDVGQADNPFAHVLNTVNPANYTAYLKGITTITNNGVQTVDGVKTRHYTVTIDTAKMLADNPAFHGQTLSDLKLPHVLTSQVYVDAHNLPIRMSVGLGSLASFDAHFSKYGETVNVTPPPADQVSDFSL